MADSPLGRWGVVLLVSITIATWTISTAVVWATLS
jgi:hypothetical protein